MRVIAAALFVFLVSLVPANANCLSQAEARAAVANGLAVPLGSIAGSVDGEIVKAQLCQQGGGYVYVLSVLKNGAVTNVTVNASR